jgi:hypothetical protein
VRLLWAGWTTYVHRAAAYQSVALLHAVYFGVFGPSALIARLFGAKLLDLDPRPRRSYWVERQPTGASVIDLTRQF